MQVKRFEQACSELLQQNVDDYKLIIGIEEDTLIEVSEFKHLKFAIIKAFGRFPVLDMLIKHQEKTIVIQL